MDTEITRPLSPQQIVDELRHQLEALQHDWIAEADELSAEADRAVEHFHMT